MQLHDAASRSPFLTSIRLDAGPSEIDAADQCEGVVVVHVALYPIDQVGRVSVSVKHQERTLHAGKGCGSSVSIPTHRKFQTMNPLVRAGRRGVCKWVSSQHSAVEGRVRRVDPRGAVLRVRKPARVGGHREYFPARIAPGVCVKESVETSLVFPDKRVFILVVRVLLRRQRSSVRTRQRVPAANQPT